MKMVCVGSLLNPPRGLSSPSLMGKSPIDTWYHWAYPECMYPGDDSTSPDIPSGTLWWAMIQLPRIYPIRMALSTDGSTSPDISHPEHIVGRRFDFPRISYPEHAVNWPDSMPARNWKSDSNRVLEQVSQVIACFQFATCLMGQSQVLSSLLTYPTCWRL